MCRIHVARSASPALAWLAALAGLFAFGCGSGGSTGPFRVQGTVTFDGQPIPSGKIVFTPDSNAGNSGPQGYADIRDGKFDTAANGQGIGGGKFDVLIQGFDAPVTPGGTPPKPLFNEYTVKADLSKESSTQDFAVPASAAADLIISSEPPP